MKLRHFKNACFAYFKHIEHMLGKNAYLLVHISPIFQIFFCQKFEINSLKIKQIFFQKNLWAGQF
jgi:hypothetical protein